ncbi:hypothetical protein [Streptomyces sp. NPDC058735]
MRAPAVLTAAALLTAASGCGLASGSPMADDVLLRPRGLQT